MNSDGIYLDNASTTKDLSISKASWLSTWHYNSNSIHRLGIDAAKEIKNAEKIILDHINGHDGQLLWTGSGSQANQLALRSHYAKGTTIVSNIEHKSILQSITGRSESLIPYKAYKVVPVLRIRETLYRIMCPALVSIQLVNNEVGTIQPVKKIVNEAKQVSVHTDAVQALGKIPIDVEDLGVEMMTLSAHKAHGPKGLGCLWVRNRILNSELYDFEYLGTKPTELICRFASIIKSREQIQIDMDHVAKLEHYFLDLLRRLQVEFDLSTSYNRLVGHLSIYFPGIENDELVFALSDRGIYISSGSACDSGKVEPSHVLTAMGIPAKRAKSTVRITLSHTNTMKEIEEAANIIANTVKELKGYGPKPIQNSTGK